MLGSCLPFNLLHYSLCLQHLSDKPDEDPKISVKINLAGLINISCFWMPSMWRSFSDLSPPGSNSQRYFQRQPWPSDCLWVAQMMQREDPGRIWQLLSFIYLSFTIIHWWVYGWQELSDKSLLPSVAYEITSMWRTLDLQGGPTWVAEQPVHTILSSVQRLTGDAFFPPKNNVNSQLQMCLLLIQDARNERIFFIFTRRGETTEIYWALSLSSNQNILILNQERVFHVQLNAFKIDMLICLFWNRRLIKPLENE